MERSARNPRRPTLVALLSMLIALGPLAIDFNLSATAEMVEDLGATSAEGQFALTATLVGLGLGQFLWGPLSDRFGRKGPLLIGIAGFVAASVGCALAPAIEVVIFVRAAQGLCASAGLVLGRTIIRDLFAGPSLTRVYARTIIAIGFTSVLGPILGSGLLQATNWRVTFGVVALVGTLLGALALIMLNETATASARSGRGLAALREYFTPLRTPSFLVFGAVIVTGSITMFTYLTSISAVLQGEHGLDPVSFAIVFAVNNAAIIAGSQISAYLVRFVSPRILLIVALTLSTAGSIALLFVSGYDGPLWLFQVAMFVVTFQQGAIAAVGIALAIHRIDRSIGAAVAMVGGLQWVLGSSASAAVAGAFGVNSTTMATSMVVTSCLALLLAVLGRKA